MHRHAWKAILPLHRCIEPARVPGLPSNMQLQCSQSWLQAAAQRCVLATMWPLAPEGFVLNPAALRHRPCSAHFCTMNFPGLGAGVSGLRKWLARCQIQGKMPIFYVNRAERVSWGAFASMRLATNSHVTRL